MLYPLNSRLISISILFIIYIIYIVLISDIKSSASYLESLLLPEFMKSS